MSSVHPLAPLTPAEIRRAATTLRSHLGCDVQDVRIKMIDLQEPPKKQLIQYNEDPSGSSASRIDKRARIYYHQKGSTDLGKAIINITSAAVEYNEKRDDVQGPVDWTEFAEVHDACNNHPAVLAEIEKLKLPRG